MSSMSGTSSGRGPYAAEDGEAAVPLSLTLRCSRIQQGCEVEHAGVEEDVPNELNGGDEELVSNWLV